VDLCVRDDNPSEGVSPPDKGVTKAKVYLWPSEFVRLVSCERVPLRWRQTFTIEPALLPLLQGLHAETRGRGTVVPLPSMTVLSRNLKHYLTRAGETRADLFTTDKTRKAMTFHDLRATGITWAAARGDAPLRIKQRAGHESFSTTEIYLREAENLSAAFGEPFPPLPPELFRVSDRVSDFGSSSDAKRLKTSAFKWPLRDLNPDALAGRGF
jgi:hypothetical protein